MLWARALFAACSLRPETGLSKALRAGQPQGLLPPHPWRQGMAGDALKDRIQLIATEMLGDLIHHQLADRKRVARHSRL